MEWRVKYGSTYEFLSKQSKEIFESSEAFKTLPQLSATEEYYLSCFSRLESSRQVGMALGAVPLSEILVFKEYLQEDDDDFVDYMQHCDCIVLDMQAKKDANKPKK